MSNPSVNKRQKERSRQERQQSKQEDRERRRAAKTTRPVTPGEDPDLAGMVAGPQPRVEEDEM